MHECVRETPLRFPIALLYLRALLWRSSDSVGGLGVARRLHKLFHDLSRLSTNHGVWPLISLYFFGNSGFVVGDDLGMRQSEDARS